MNKTFKGNTQQINLFFEQNGLSSFINTKVHDLEQFVFQRNSSMRHIQRNRGIVQFSL